MNDCLENWDLPFLILYGNTKTSKFFPNLMQFLNYEFNWKINEMEIFSISKIWIFDHKSEILDVIQCDLKEGPDPFL